MTDAVLDEARKRARAGRFPGKEIAGHVRWLRAELGALEAYAEFGEFSVARAQGGAAPPPDLARRLRTLGKAAGAGVGEDIRVLGRVLGERSGREASDGFFDEAVKPFAAYVKDGQAVEQAVLERLVGLFPEGATDGGAWLRLLLAAGAVDAVAEGRVVPVGGVAGWVSSYTKQYNYTRASGGGVTRQPLPGELLDVVRALAPRLRAEKPVVLHESRYTYASRDAQLMDICLELDIRIAEGFGTLKIPAQADARRDLRLLAAHPVYGRRLEADLYERVSGGGSFRRHSGSALTLWQGTPELDERVAERVRGHLADIRGGGLARAGDSLTELGHLLDEATLAVLDWAPEELARLSPAGALARTLRGGLPCELGWPELDEAVAELCADGACEPRELTVGAVWPGLTVASRTRAIAIEPGRRVAESAIEIPEDAQPPTVRYIDGAFLVSWREEEYGPGTGYWSDAPEETFALSRSDHGDAIGSLYGPLGYQFATIDGAGLFDGTRVLRRGERYGLGGFAQQLSDGQRFWSSELHHERNADKGWAEFDPDTGERGEPGLPDFFAGGPPAGHIWDSDRLSLARLPEAAHGSPLGHRDGLAGFRVSCTRVQVPCAYTVEGTDGRRAEAATADGVLRPWGVLRMPEGGAQGVVADFRPISFCDGEDRSRLWSVPGFASARRGPFALLGGPMPPPAYWHFLRPRDAASSRALRGVDEARAEALMAAGTADAVRELLPDVRDPRIAEGVAEAARVAAGFLRGVRELAEKVSR
ncbi:hypothetical protein SRB5_60030 [Streptomyces sp. RB5]|uniref:Uncharacterized protein n=1 Tax=Streptomyces smaragdinus TaxID=2585196 RepID=A0A7K0CS38_9ACTN|nr:hypothetical protein [Streptomyces smaragdinus]MQY15812.1 hypothetical protein [Streptomyces smaragdinus]